MLLFSITSNGHFLRRVFDKGLLWRPQNVRNFSRRLISSLFALRSSGVVWKQASVLSFFTSWWCIAPSCSWSTDNLYPTVEQTNPPVFSPSIAMWIMIWIIIEIKHKIVLLSCSNHRMCNNWNLYVVSEDCSFSNYSSFSRLKVLMLCLFVFWYNDMNNYRNKT